MQFLKTTLIFLFATLISAAAFPQDAETAIEASFTGIRTEQCADGKRYTFSIYSDGNLDGTIVAINDPAAPELSINAFDADGAQLEVTALDDANCDTTCQIQGFIQQFGLRAIVWAHLPHQPFWESGIANVGLVVPYLPWEQCPPNLLDQSGCWLSKMKDSSADYDLGRLSPVL